MMMLRDLVSTIEPLNIYGDIDKEITGISCDSRKIKKGNLFVAIRGYSTDGHLHIHDATSRGASAVVVEGEINSRESGDFGELSRSVESRESIDKFLESKGVATVVVQSSRLALARLSSKFYSFPSNKLSLVGVTGTNGKTTTSYLIRSILQHWDRNVGFLGTVGYMIGGEMIEAPNTTPESLDLQRYLFQMVNSGITHAVVEVSSHALSLGRVEGCEFDVAVFTNITRDHIDFHGTMEEYFRAKMMLLNYLKKDGTTVINRDDPRVNELSNIIKGTVLTYGMDKNADIMATLLPFDRSKKHPVVSLLYIKTPSGTFETSTTLLGRHNIYNILAATSACFALGVPLYAISNGIKDQGCVPGRLEKIELGQDYTVVVDYAHSDDALRNIIDALREWTQGRLITVFGCGGNRDRGKRSLMGKVASELSDIVIITSDNPRDEEPLGIINEIISGIKRNNYHAIPDREEAIRFAIDGARKGDTVLIAGKGHEDYQIIKGVKYHFDDREVARETIMRARSKG